MIFSFFFQHRWWLWPILAFALITPFTPWLDLTIANYFYLGNGNFSSAGIYSLLFDYGVLPAQLLCGLAVILFVGSFFFKAFKPWRSISLILVVSLAIGAGLITHVILKDHWGRPRPKQVIEFGGTQPFRPYYSPNIFHQPQPSKSFPCGHCTMGFYFFTLAWIGRRSGNKPLFWLGLFVALFLGGWLSWTRMAQGGHFFSDTLAGMLVMWLTAYVCTLWMPQKEATS